MSVCVCQKLRARSRLAGECWRFYRCSLANDVASLIHAYQPKTPAPDAHSNGEKKEQRRRISRTPFSRWRFFTALWLACGMQTHSLLCGYYCIWNSGLFSIFLVRLQNFKSWIFTKNFQYQTHEFRANRANGRCEIDFGSFKRSVKLNCYSCRDETLVRDMIKWRQIPNGENSKSEPSTKWIWCACGENVQLSTMFHLGHSLRRTANVVRWRREKWMKEVVGVYFAAHFFS